VADPEVVDQPERGRFALEVDGHEGELTYRLQGDRLVLDHTGVPDELGGRGLGGVLVRAAVRRAEAEGLTLVPRCPFARSWLEKHPEEAGRVAIDWPAER
jgi:predicted GNAT family acetyltransferase